MWNLISVMQLREKLLEKKEIYLVDLRDKEDYEAGHIPGAISVPEGELEGLLGEFPDGKELVLICYRGPGSILAAKKLSSCGRDAAAVCGGMKAWEELERDGLL